MSNPEKIALLTDSCADLSKELRAGKPIYMVPLRVRCKDKEYEDGVNVFAADIYKHLKKGELPKTSLPLGESIEKIFDRIRKDGYEKVIAVNLSSGLSGTANMVRLMGERRRDLEVRCFDSLSGSLGQGATVLQLWEEIQAGASWESLVNDRTPALLRSVYPFFSVDTLEYLQKGGRIGKVTALAGTMLNIKPLIGFSEDGQLSSVAKVRGRKAVQSKLMELVAQHVGNSKRYNLAVANGGAREEMMELRSKMEAAFPHYVNFWEGEMDATLSVYIGDGVLGAAVQILDGE